MYVSNSYFGKLRQTWRHSVFFFFFKHSVVVFLLALTHTQKKRFLSPRVRLTVGILLLPLNSHQTQSHINKWQSQRVISCIPSSPNRLNHRGLVKLDKWNPIFLHQGEGQWNYLRQATNTAVLDYHTLEFKKVRSKNILSQVSVHPANVWATSGTITSWNHHSRERYMTE